MLIFKTNDTKYKAYNGLSVDLIRSLSLEEADLHETGAMYKAKLSNGHIIDLFKDELIKK